MSSQRPDWWEWINLNKSINEPLELKDNAPEDVKIKFEEWKKKKEEEQANGLWA